MNGIACELCSMSFYFALSLSLFLRSILFVRFFRSHRMTSEMQNRGANKHEH